MQIPQSSVLQALQIKNASSPSGSTNQNYNSISSNYYHMDSNSSQLQRNSNISFSSNVHRNKKQSPNIVRDNKIFPNDFFQYGHQNLNGSPSSSQILPSTGGQNMRDAHNLDFDELNENFNTIQRLPISKPSLFKPENVPSNPTKKFMFPNEELTSNQALKQSYGRRRDQQMNINDLQNYSAHKDQFESIQHQFLHMSIDSDQLVGRQGSLTRKSLPFGIIEADQNIKGRNYAGSPPPVFTNPQNLIQRNNENFNSINSNNSVSKNHQQLSIEQQMRQSKNQFHNSNNDGKLPGLRNSIGRNSQNYLENELMSSHGQIPNFHNSITPPSMNLGSQDQYLRPIQQRVPIFMRHNVHREELENSKNNSSSHLRIHEQETFVTNSQNNLNANQNQYMNYNSSNISINNDSISSLPRQVQVSRVDQEEIFHAASPQISQIHDYSSSNLASGGKHSLNSSTLHQPNHNHHYWSRSPQILRDLEIHHQINNQAIYFPQSTRNNSIQRSPSIVNNSDKGVKFPNIFNHNNSQITTGQQSINSSQNQHSSLSHPQIKLKKGQINLDTNYQIAKQQQQQQQQRKESVILERKETSESEQSQNTQQQLQQPMKKATLDRKMLTSRDQDDRWVKVPKEKPIIRHQSKSKLEHVKEQVLGKDKDMAEEGKSYNRKNSPFSQSGMCWYNSNQNSNDKGMTTFGPSPSNKENPRKKRKEDLPRHSLPENRNTNQSIIPNQEEQNLRLQSKQTQKRKKSRANDSQNLKLSYSELETPNFKQQQSLLQRQSLKQNKFEDGHTQAKKLYDQFNKIEETPQTSRTRHTQQIQLTEEEDDMHINYVSCQHEIFEDDNNSLSSRAGAGSPDMRCANYDNSQTTAGDVQKQQLVQFASRKGNVQDRGRSPEPLTDGEIKKFKVVTKSKKREKEHTQESKSKILKEIEKNLKKVKNPTPHLVEQQEQVNIQQQNQGPQISQNLAEIKEGNNNNLPKKIPMIKKSQIQNNPSTQNLQKANITRNPNKMQKKLASNQQQPHTESQDYEQQQQKENDIIIKNLENQPNNYHQQTQAQYFTISQKRIPLTSIENQNIQIQSQQLQSQKDQNILQNINNKILSQNQQQQQQQQQNAINIGNQKHHIQQIYMAAQIPQEFNGMITFMNINSEHHSSQNNDGENETFKKTGGSIMQGTMFSMTGGSHNGSQASCNNSIIMMRSESNYMTSDFGQMMSPMSTSHFVIMQQKCMPGADTSNQSKANLNEDKGSIKQKQHQNQMQEEENQFERDESEQFKLEFQNSKIKKPNNSHKTINNSVPKKSANYHQ